MAERSFKESTRKLQGKESVTDSKSKALPDHRAPAQNMAANVLSAGNRIGLTDNRHRGLNVPTNASTQPHVTKAGSETVQMKTEISYTPQEISVGQDKVLVGNRMNARLDVLDPIRGTATGNNWVWMKTLERDLKTRLVRGHLLNHDLGGHAVAENLFPITHMANLNHKNAVEYPVKKMVHDKYTEIKDKHLSEQEEKIESAKKENIISYDVNVISADPSESGFDCSAAVGDKKLIDHKVVFSVPGKKVGAEKAEAKDATVPVIWRHAARQVQNDRSNIDDAVNTHLGNASGRTKDLNTQYLEVVGKVHIDMGWIDQVRRTVEAEVPGGLATRDAREILLAAWEKIDEFKTQFGQEIDEDQEAVFLSNLMGWLSDTLLAQNPHQGNVSSSLSSSGDDNGSAQKKSEPDDEKMKE